MEHLEKRLFVKFYFCVGLLAVSANLAHPFTPKLITELQLPDFMFGAAFACMSLTTFFLAPFWGKLSDSLGRMGIMGFSCFGYALGQLMFGYAFNIPTIIVARLFSGIFCATHVVCAMAFISDHTDGNKRLRHMSYYAAAVSVCSAAGYLIGGFLGETSMRLAFWVQAGMLSLSGLFMLILLRDKRRHDQKRPALKAIIADSNPLKVFSVCGKVMSRTAVIFFISVFIASFATYAFDNAFNYYIKEALDFPSTYNGMIKAAVGIIGLAANFSLNIWLANHTELRKSIVVVFLMCFVSVTCVVIAENTVAFVLLSILALTFNAVYLPMQQSISTRIAENDSNGISAGLYSSSKAAGMVAGSLFAGFIYSFGNKLPFVFAGGLFFAAASLAFVIRGKACGRRKFSEC